MKQASLRRPGARVGGGRNLAAMVYTKSEPTGSRF